MSDISALPTMDGDQLGDPMFVHVSLDAAEESFPLLYETSKEDVKSESTHENTAQQMVVVAAKQTKLKGYRCVEMVHDMQCAYHTTDEDRLIRHVRKVHRGENPFQCTMCDYSTYNKSLFEEHVRIHQGIKPFKCRFCPYASASKKNAKKHEMIHRPDNPLKCSQCDFIGRHVRSLESHMITHLKCSKCELKMTDVQQLKTHDCAGATKKIKCINCLNKFSNNRNYHLHMRSAKKCEDCDVILCNKIRLTRHMSTVHGKDMPMPCSYTCDVCKWTGTNPPRILLHLVHHPPYATPDIPGIDILKKHGIVQ